MFTRPRKRVFTRTIGASRTEQKWLERQDVNSIVARCLRDDTDGLVTCGLNYVDVTSLPSDLQSMLNYRNDVSELYDSLPEDAKNRWRTPSDLIKALDDEFERPFFDKFGMLKKPEVELPTKVEIVNPTSITPVTPNGAA